MRPLTAQEECIIVARRQRGDTIFDIACDLDRPQAVVWRCLKRHGLTSRRRRITTETRARIRAAAGWSDNVRRETGVSRATFYRYRQCE